MYQRNLQPGFLRDIMRRMHAEAVKQGGIPSVPGLIHDSSRAMTCAECGASYYLHYDLDAEMRSTLFSIVAAEIISARHPHHEPSLFLELPEEKTHNRAIAGLIRLDLGSVRKKKSGAV